MSHLCARCWSAPSAAGRRRRATGRAQPKLGGSKGSIGRDSRRSCVEMSAAWHRRVCRVVINAAQDTPAGARGGRPPGRRASARRHAVENVCKGCAWGVDYPYNENIFFARNVRRGATNGDVDRTSRFPSLDPSHEPARILSFPLPTFLDRVVTLHRFERTINGCTYLIEAMRVDEDRWRAYLISVQGGPTALMPFYGATAEQAVRRLADWLTLAHQSPTIPV